MRFPTFALALVPAFLPACHCNPSFHTDVRGQMTIPGSPLGGVLDAFPLSGLTNIDFNQNQDFRNAGITKDQVNSVVADSVQLRIDNPNNQDFKFLDNLQFSVKAGNQQAQIAQKSSIRQLNLPAPNPTLSMDVTKAELKPYVTASSMSIIAQGQGTAPPNDTQIGITVGLNVEIHVY